MSTQSSFSIGGSGIGTPLQQILDSDSIQPGADISYQLAKLIYLYHPLGGKLVEMPVKMAQSQPRTLILDAPGENSIRKAFLQEWTRIKADDHIRGVMFQARIYGVASIVFGAPNEDTALPLNLKTLGQGNIYFNVLDPLNMSGSMTLDQNPNSPNFQKFGDIKAAGQTYHRSRACVVMNEQPVYLAYSASGFGYVGRSVYQRALYPLKSFIQSMVTDDMVTRKAGLLIAMLKGAGSIISNIMQKAAGIKRRLLKDAVTDNVLSIELDEKIESLNLQNTDTAMTTARSNILRNIATAADMPAKVLEQEGFAEGFGEGTEDTKNLVRYVNGIRKEMQPLYEYFDRIVQYRAWTPEFFESLKAAFPDSYGDKTYEQAFYGWQDAFTVEWPSLLEEPESELAKMETVKMEGLVSVFTALSAQADPINRANLTQWVQDNVNEYKKLFKVPMTLDIDALLEYEPPVAEPIDFAPAKGE